MAESNPPKKVKRSRAKDSNFFVIHRWMATVLKLHMAEKEVFAIIYGFTIAKRGKKYYDGSLQYLMDFLGTTSKQTVRNAIKALLKKGYICCIGNSAGATRMYQANLKLINQLLDASDASANEDGIVPPGGAESYPEEGTKSSPPGGTESYPNNISQKNNASHRDSISACPEWIALSDAAKAALDEWTHYKEECGAPLTLTSTKTLAKKLRTQIDKCGETAVVELINECVERQWKSIVWERLETPQRRTAHPQPARTEAETQAFDDSISRDIARLKAFAAWSSIADADAI